MVVFKRRSGVDGRPLFCQCLPLPAYSRINQFHRTAHLLPSGLEPCPSFIVSVADVNSHPVVHRDGAPSECHSEFSADAVSGNLHRLFKDAFDYTFQLIDEYGGVIKIYGVLGVRCPPCSRSTQLT